jgi:MFS family permease
LALSSLAHLQQIVVSLSGGEGSQVVFVALYSVMSCFARSLLGEISQRALLSRGTPRPAFLALSCLLMTAACAACSVGSVPLLYVAALLGGFAFGSYWVIMPSMLSEVYGTRCFGTIYSATSSAPAVGGFLLSNLLTAGIYDRVAKGHGDTRGICVGSDCFRDAFIIISVLNAISSVASLVVLARTRLRYHTIHSCLLLHHAS